MTEVRHRHHIVPRHVGGTDDPSNIALLTIPEHAEAHRLLYEKYGRWQDRVAWRSLSGQISFAEARLEANIAAQTGRPKSPEHRRKLSESRRGKKLPEHVRRAISEGHKGLKHPEEVRRKIGDGSRGRKHSAEEIEKRVSIRKDSKPVIVDGMWFRSHSAAAIHMSEVWGCSKENARNRIRERAGRNRRVQKKYHGDLFGPLTGVN